MFQSINELLGRKVTAIDGDIGSIDDFYISQKTWEIDHVVVQIGGLLSTKKVLITPTSVDRLKPSGESLHINLTSKEIEQAPTPNNIEAKSWSNNANVSPRLPIERVGGGLFQEQNIGMQPDSIVQMIQAEASQQSDIVTNKQNHALKIYSAKSLIGTYIMATDGDLGHLEDIVLEQQNWSIKQMIVDTRNWWPGKKVCLEPSWVESIDEVDSKIYVNQTQTQIKEQSEFEWSALNP